MFCNRAETATIDTAILPDAMARMYDFVKIANPRLPILSGSTTTSIIFWTNLSGSLPVSVANIPVEPFSVKKGPNVAS